MSVGTAFVDSFTASVGAWTPYNTGTAVAGSAVPFLSDSSSATWVQATTLSAGKATFTSGLGNVTTGGSAIVRVRPVVRISRGDGKQTTFSLSGVAANVINPSASGQTTYAGGWATGPTAGEVWSSTQANALTLTVTTTSSAQRVTQGSFEYDLASIPAGTPSITSATTDKPEVTWTYSDADNTAQASAVVKVFSAAQYGAGGFDPDTSASLWSTVVAGTARSATPTSPIVTNGLVYRPYVRVIKSPYGGAVRGAWTTSTAASTATFTPPSAPTLNFTWDATNSRLQVNVIGSASPFRYTLRRGTAVIGTALSTMPASGTATLYDYLMPRGTAVVYSATITSGTSASPILTSSTALGTVTTGTATSWEIRPLADPATSFVQKANVTSVSWERTEGLGVFRPLGSSGAVVVAGDLGLDDGTLEIVTPTRAAWEAIEALLSRQDTLLLTSPFRGADGANDRHAIRITSRSWASEGTLDNPVQRVSASFVGVDADLG